MAITHEHSNVHNLMNQDMPAIFTAADQASLSGQQRFNWEIRLELSMLIVAALAGLFTLRWTLNSATADWAGIIAAIAFFIGFALQVDRLVRKPDESWHDGRAVAESAKTLAWRYSVGGNPFRIDNVNPKEADAILIARFREILHKMEENDTPILLTREGEQITPSMRRIRTYPLAARREIYANGRIQDQWHWYTAKAQWNHRRANFMSTLLLAIEVAGFVMAICKAIGLLQIDLLGLAGTAAAVIATWMQMKQYQVLARSYTIAAMELATIKGNISDQDNEVDWSHFVDEAEEAISREHTLWLASHSNAIKHI